MEPAALLAELRALADNVPDFASFTPTSSDHHRWLAKIRAFVPQGDPTSKFSLDVQMSFLAYESGRKNSVASILLALHRTIADLELRVLSDPEPDRAFGPGAVYDFLKTLRDLLASATQSIFIIDPYLDEQVFDAYLATISPTVVVRLLTGKVPLALRPAVAKFIAQTKMSIATRSSELIHDRVIFLDEHSCWVLGQSIKDAAKSKPTYLAPMDSNTTQLKKAMYEQIWGGAKPL
jgi:hypothetical protein